MTYKDLLVHLDDSRGCRKRVDAAVRLARQHGAHLTGVYPIVKIPLLHYIRRHIPRDVQATMDAEAQRQAETALEGFRQAAEGSGVAYETRTDHALDSTIASVLSTSEVFSHRAAHQVRERNPRVPSNRSQRWACRVTPGITGPSGSADRP